MNGRDLEEYEYVILTEKSSQIEALSVVVGATLNGKWDPAYNVEEALALVPLRGHVTTAKEPNEYTQYPYSSWDEDGIYVFPEEFEMKPNPGAETLLKNAIEHLKKAKKILIATDYDNEGATLAMNVIRQAGVEDRVERMLEMGSLHPTELRHSLDNPIDIPYMNMFKAGHTRAFLDWSEGMSYSRALSYYLGDHYKAMLNFGGVLTPIVYLVVERERAYDNHEVSYYWNVEGHFDADGQKIPFVLKYKPKEKEGYGPLTPDFDSEEDALAAISNFEDKTINIASLISKRKKKGPPLLFDFSSLKQHMGHKKKYSPDQTDAAAQKLYDQDKLETYARSDVPYIKESEFEDAPVILARLAEYEIVDSRLITEALKNDLPKRTGKNGTFFDKKVTSHGAIIPTKSGDIQGRFEKLSPIEKNVFIEVSKRYVANFLPDYEYDSVSGISEEFNGFALYFSENIPVKSGWKALYEPELEDEILHYVPTIPKSLSKGDPLVVEAIKYRKIETKPKPLFTILSLEEALTNIAKLFPGNEDIQKYLGDAGIGTVATRTDTIKKAMDPEKNKGVPWFTDVKGKLRASKKAKKFISIMPPELVSPIKRALLSKKLKAIEHGEVEPEDVIKEMRIEVQENIAKIKKIFEDNGPIAVALLGGKTSESLGKCPICKEGNIVEKKKIFGCDKAKYAKNEDGSIRNDGCKYMIRKAGLEKLGKKNITKTEVKKLLSSGKVTVSLVSKKGMGYTKKMVVDEKWGVAIDFSN